MKITVEATINAPIEVVWRAYNTPEDVTQWNFASDDWHCPTATADFRVGGTFSSRMEAKDGSQGFDFEGTYTKIVPNELIEYEFGDRTAQITFEETPQGVFVQVTFDAEETFPPEYQKDGWQAILNNFKKHVEGTTG
jgi:uncharacterized protein YndB with AHSA1/START domain